MLFNGAQIHMLVNHLPVIGFLGMIPALIVAMVVKSIDIKRFVLLSVVVVGISALAPYFTGEPAEDVVENLPGVSKDQIHEHEELAEKATIVAVLTAAAAAAAFFMQRRNQDSLRRSIPIVLGLSLIAAGLMGAAAHEGGMIRHSEIDPAAKK